MPKVYITKEDKLNSRLAALLFGTMKVKRKTQTEMGDVLGISQQAFGKKLKKSQFTFLELVKVFDELDLPDEDIIRVMKAR